MDRNRDDRRGLIPQTSTVPSRQQLLRRKPAAQRVPQPVIVQEETVVTQCNRCEKDFVQKKAPDQKSARGRVGRVARLFKLCEHCREMGKGRSRRWQKKTKEHGGLCRRCGVDLGAEDENYVLCKKCRNAFRNRKLRRATEGKCVQCGQGLDAALDAAHATKDDEENNVSTSSEGAQKDETIVLRKCHTCREFSRTKAHKPKPLTNNFMKTMYE